MNLSPQWLDELKSRTTLSALIQRTVKLTRAGHEWKACCPFHNEKTPSFTVNDAKGFYHCFGCQAHGGAIDWMMQQHGLAFMDAVKELASGSGMEVPAPDPRAAQRAEQRATLHDVMQAAQDWLVTQLRGQEGGKARDYLASRGFSARVIDEFGFGYAPDSRQALKEALSGFDESLLIEAGLRIAVEGKQPYDRFRDRLMLPIHDPRGRVIAFGGRILEKLDGVAKYLNSPDTPLFDKGRTLYNLHRAGPASRKSGRIVAVEGYMDVIALADAGFGEAVAPMGTALTEQQIELMWRLCDKPVLCFDGDAAGQRAAMKAIIRALPLLRPGHSLQIVSLPDGLDPDDLIRQRGKAAMEKLLAEPASMADIIWQHERDAAPLASPEDKAGLKARLLAHVDTIADQDIRSLYRRDLLDRYGDFAFPRRRPRPKAKIAFKPDLKSQADRMLAVLFRGLSRYPHIAEKHADQLLRFSNIRPKFAATIQDIFDHRESEIEVDPPRWYHPQFLVDGATEKAAHEDLESAIAALVTVPLLDDAIRLAVSSEAIEDVDRLSRQKSEILRASARL